MLKRTLRSSPLVLIACALIALPAAGSTLPPDCGVEPEQICDETKRMNFLADVEAGTSWEDLMTTYGHCAVNTLPLDKSITYDNNVGNRWYEEMNGCGYHPQARMAACDVEIKRNFGYGWFPNGSHEHVTFCFGCGAGGAWIQGDSQVHVTNDNGSAANPSYFMMAFATAPVDCPARDGASFPIMATLSWARPAGNPCTGNPQMIWGNRITFDTRADP